MVGPNKEQNDPRPIITSHAPILCTNCTRVQIIRETRFLETTTIKFDYGPPSCLPRFIRMLICNG